MKKHYTVVCITTGQSFDWGKGSVKAEDVINMIQESGFMKDGGWQDMPAMYLLNVTGKKKSRNTMICNDGLGGYEVYDKWNAL